jgi:hypothetical protein
MSTTPDNPAPLARRVPGELVGRLTAAEFDAVCEKCEHEGPQAALRLLSRGRVDSDGRPSRRRTLLDALERDPAWAERWQDAQSTFLARVAAQITENAFTPDETIDYDPKSGAVVRTRIDRRNMNALLLRLAERLDPDWAPGRRVTSTNTNVNLNVDATNGAYVLTPADIMLLEPEDRPLLVDLLRVIRDRKKGGTDGPAPVA